MSRFIKQAIVGDRFNFAQHDRNCSRVKRGEANFGCHASEYIVNIRSRELGVYDKRVIVGNDIEQRLTASENLADREDFQILHRTRPWRSYR